MRSSTNGRSWRPLAYRARVGSFALSLCLSIALSSVAHPANAQSRNDPKLVISKSTVGFLAEPVKKTIQFKAGLFIPAGTRLLLYDKIDPDAERRLVLTEFGVWGYIKNGNYDKIEKFGREGKILFITRNFPIQLSQNLTGMLTPSETYSVVKEGDGLFKIRLDNRKFTDFKNDWSREYWILSNSASIVDLSDDLKENDIDYFTRGFIDDIFEFWKPCREEDVLETRYQAGAGIDLNLFERFKLILNAQTEKTRVRQFTKGEIVHRRYYTRNLTGGAYSLTKIEICQGEGRGRIEYHWITPEPNEYIIDKDWAGTNNLSVDGRTGEVIVSCYDDFDKYVLALEEDLRVPRTNIPFLIPLTARHVDVSDFSRCRGE